MESLGHLVSDSRDPPRPLRDPLAARRGRDGRGVPGARDTKLGREVAIKVLPQRLSADSDSLARFERRTIARSPTSRRIKRGTSGPEPKSRMNREATKALRMRSLRSARLAPDNSLEKCLRSLSLIRNPLF